MHTVHKWLMTSEPKKFKSDLFQEHISIFEVDVGESTGKNRYAGGSA